MKQCCTQTSLSGPSMPMRTKRYYLLLFSVFQLFLTSGVVFGWPSLQLILWDEGVYKELCPPDTEEFPCNEQNLRLDLIYMVGYFFVIGANIINGPIMDRWGPRFITVMGCCFIILGSCLFAISCADHFDAFVISFAFIGLGGCAIELSAFHITNLFPQNPGTVMAIETSAFGASAFVFQIFGLIESNFKKTFNCTILFYSYAVLIGILLVCSVFVQPKKAFTKEMLEDKNEDADETSLLSKSEQTLKQSLLSKDFIWLTCFQCILALRLSYTLGTINTQLYALGDKTYLYSSIFNWIYTLGVLFIPIVGWLLDKELYYGVAASVISGLGIGIFSLIPILSVQIITFIFVSFANVIVWATFYSAMAVRFGFKHYGSLAGICSFIVALFGVLQYGLVSISSTYLKNKFNYMSSIITAFILPLFYYIYFLRRNPIKH